MAFIPRIIPYFEAVIYMIFRFSEKRASQNLQQFRKKFVNTPNSEFAFYEKIVEIEKELDAQFGSDKTIAYYFTPMKTRECVTDYYPLSPGRLLLTLPDELDFDCGFDSICNYYNNASTRDKLVHFCDIYHLDSHYQTAEKSTSISDFMQVVDDILVDAEDKWKLIDAVANPVKHLSRLQSIVEAIVNAIEAHLSDFSALIERNNKSFLAIGNPKQLLQQFHIEIQDDEGDVNNTIFRPSLLLLNGFFMRTFGDVPQVFIGSMIFDMIRWNSETSSIKEQADLLKALSDTTRLKALYEIRDKYSFGQELAEDIGGSRNAMYYHLEKLFSMGLVTRRETEYRTLYTMNKNVVYDKLTALRDFLVGGWKPEDEEQKE
ncbi:MAG: helix-turn-helix transcriptional regulator [Clostridia bacterium]|nr:helix-turn-helix transcriptional regulator [Clostridia bacterium]